MKKGLRALKLKKNSNEKFIHHLHKLFIETSLVSFFFYMQLQMLWMYLNCKGVLIVFKMFLHLLEAIVRH